MPSTHRGFTLFELLVVIGIFAMIGGSALFVSMETYRGSNFHSDRNLFIAILQRARAEAMNNVCLGTCTDGKSHGVKILHNGDLTLFQGTDYDHRDNTVDATFNMHTASTTGASEIVFTQLSGAATPAEIVLQDGAGHTSTTTVSAEGQITWTN